MDYVSTSRVSDDGVVLYNCTVKIGDEDMVSVEEYKSEAEAELRAALKAADVLKARHATTSEGKRRKFDVAPDDEDRNIGAMIDDND